MVTFERHLKLLWHCVVNWTSFGEIEVFLIVFLIIFILIFTCFYWMMYSRVGELALIILVCVIRNLVLLLALLSSIGCNTMLLFFRLFVARDFRVLIIFTKLALN